MSAEAAPVELIDLLHKFTVTDPEKLGCVMNESDEAYHGSPAINRSKAEAFRASPMEFHGLYVSGVIPRREETDAFRVGKAVHCLVNEGEAAFAARFVAVPVDAPKRPTVRQINAKKPSPDTVEAIKWWADFDASTVGKTLCEPDEIATTRAVYEAVMRHPGARQLMQGSQGEVTWRHHAEALGFTVQCKTDLVNDRGCDLTNGMPFFADVKTVPSLTRNHFGVPRNFLKVWEKSMIDFGYHRQDAYYSAIVDMVMSAPWRCIFIACGKNAPNDIALIEIDAEARAKGMIEVSETWQALSDALRNDKWPTIPPVIHRVGLPKWYAERDAD